MSSYCQSNPLKSHQSVFNMINGRLWNPKLVLKENSLWIKFKAQDFACGVSNKHDSEGKKEKYFLLNALKFSLLKYYYLALQQGECMSLAFTVSSIWIYKVHLPGFHMLLDSNFGCSRHVELEDSSLRLFSFLVSPSLSTVLSVWQVPLFHPSAWALMAGLPGFASYGSSLHLGAGCQ